MNKKRTRPGSRLFAACLAFVTPLALLHCTKEQAAGVCDPPCGIGQTCSTEGRCVSNAGTSGTSGAAGSGMGGTGSGGTAPTGGSLPNGGTTVITPPDASDDVDLSDADSCAEIELEVSNVVPTVVLLIDRSGSMSSEDLDPAYPGVSRWDGLKTALLDPTSVVANLDAQVRFGVVFYAGGQSRQQAMCPVLDRGGDPATLMPPATGMFAAFSAYFQPLDTLPDTPTGESVAAAAADLAAVTDVGPKYIVLATDGEPDLCDDRQEPSGRARSLEEVTNAFTAGISTFVISVGTDVAETHLAEIANAGQGFPPDDMPATPRFFQVTTQQALADAFQQIITGARTCTFTLDGEIDPELAGQGQVSIDGTPIPMSDADGWRVIDGQTIELVGSACQTIQMDGHVITARFPCEVVVVPPR